nr:oligopeptide/dipeptide ABC transporter ATP-binding protein [Baekduia soli]
MSVAGATEGAIATAPLLDVRGVTKEYPVGGGLSLRRARSHVHAITQVSMSVAEGEVFGLVGESGCGKSTLSRLMVGLELPTSGEVRVAGVSLSEAGRRELRVMRRDVQLMFQDPDASLDPRMRVGASVAEPLAIQRVGTRRERTAAVARLLEEVGLRAEVADRLPHELSGGQRQRVGLARALALRPRLIVADEPVSALDVSVQAQVLNLLRETRARHGLTYVVISHDLAVIRYLADRVGVMYLGRLVEVGPAERIYAAPAHPYTSGLVETIPRPEPDVRRRRRPVAIRGELPSPVDPPSGCRFRTRCPRAEERCAAEVPALRPFGPGHVAACHFPLLAPAAGASDGVVDDRG